ncbi:MAG: hypothetical protein GX369_02190 [Euryarchaeota archaeon]|nr:hypothetical protein [Euryarchaeota archaeon]
MAQFSLHSRVVGPWAGFERKIIAAGPHVGWVRFSGQRRFNLRKSPFLPVDIKRVYHIPDDIELYDEELVELDVGPSLKRIDSIMRRTTLVGDFEEHYLVENVRRLTTELPRPFLEKDEFLSRLVDNWKGGKSDHLDKALALQMLSCPRTPLGPGGIGTQSFDLSGASKALDNLRKTISMHLPTEFSRPNGRFELAFLSSRENLTELRNRIVSGRVDEASYNYLKMVDPSHHPLPQHVPTILYNSQYIPKNTDPDPDILEYQLCGLMLHPVVSEEIIEHIECTLSNILEESDPSYAGYNVPFDQDALSKIAMALCRLHQKNYLDENMLDQSKSWFKDMYRQFADLRIYYSRPGGSTRIGPEVDTSYAYISLGPRDNEVLREIFRGVNEVGLDYVSYAGLKKSLRPKKITASQVRDSIQRLISNGLIISRENDNLFRPVRRFNK